MMDDSKLLQVTNPDDVNVDNIPVGGIPNVKLIIVDFTPEDETKKVEAGEINSRICYKPGKYLLWYLKPRGS